MYKISYVRPEQADAAPEAVRKVYDVFKGKEIPEPLQLHSASPELLSNRFDNIQYYMSHPSLSFPLLAAIRYAIARSLGYDCCTGFNCNLLERCGMSTSEIETLYDYARAHTGCTSDNGLEEREQMLVRFVVNAVQEPTSASAEQLEGLRAEGWTDKDIFDALSHGANMVATSIIDSAFRLR